MPQYIPGDMGRPPGKSLKKARNELVSRVATVEEDSMGALPTAIVYSSALAASDDTEAARWAVIIARELDLPAPPPATVSKRGVLRRRKPESMIDPYTGKAVSQGRAQSLMGLGASLGALLAEPERVLPKRTPVSPEQVAAYVNAADFVPDVSAEFALGQALDMERKGTPVDKLRQNLAVAAEFNETAGAWTDEEVLVYARWWAENKDRTMTRGDLVTLTTPELTEAITAHKAKINTNPYAQLAEGKPGEEIFYSDLNRLVAARDAAINDVSLLDDARRILHEVETPSWGDRVTAWVGHEIFDPLFKASQRIFVEAATLPVMAIKLGEAAFPGGSTLGDAVRSTQRDRSYFIQRINGGSSIGEIYAENGMVPSWVGAGMDFAVGWLFDPLIVGGAALTTYRASKVAPGLVRVPGVVGLGSNRILQNPRIFEWSARRFSTSNRARGLLKAAYKGDDSTELLQQIDRLATHFEARSPLEYRFMTIARERILAKYPRLNEKAYGEWAEMLEAHFGIRPRQGSLAEEVVRVRQGQATTAEEALLHQPSAMIAGRQYVESPSGAMVPRAQAMVEAEEVIANGTIPLSLASEIPHRLIGTGVRRSTIALRESRLAQTSLGRRVRAGFTPNPGNIYRLGDRPEQYLYRRGLRWREFGEDELRAYQARALEIQNSGVSVERRLIELRDEMDSTALLKVTARHGVPEDVSEEILKEINRHTRQLDQGQVFGAIEQGAGLRIRPTPVMEAQLTNEAFSADPVLLRKVLNRYQGTVRDWVNGAVNNLGAHITPEAMENIARLAYKGTDFGKFMAHGAMRTWKFMVVPRPAYIGRVILLEEGGRWLATTGSVLDRLLAQELKLGIGPIKADLGRRLDERGIGQIVVPVGENKIVLPRIGAQEYEPLANQVFRTEDLLDDAMRHALTSDVADSASGHYGVIMPDSAQYSTLWERILNKQFGNSASGVVALESVAAGNDVRTTTQILRRWAGKEGFLATRSRIGLRGEDIPEWADDLAKMTHAYTGGNSQVAAAAVARTINRDMLRLIPDDMRAPIHGPLLDRLSAATGTRNTIRSLTDAVYNAMVRWPESVLNRQPYYKYWKRASTESYYRQLDGQGYGTKAKPITPQIEAAIDKASREFALAQVKKIMFDFAENTRLGEMVASVLPFVQPWLESYQVWGHIFVHRNPSLIGYVNQLGRLGMESGFIRRDEDGVLTIPWSWHSDVLGLLPWFNQLPEGFGMSAPLSGLNIVFGQTGEVSGIPVPLPGLSPWAGVLLKSFFSGTENPFLTSYLFQYGFGTPVVPIWMERAARVIKPDAFNDDRLESVAMDFLKWYQIAGTDRYTNDQGEVVYYSNEVLKERAMNDARRVQGLLGVTGLFSLTAGKFQFPEEYREREEELEELIDQFGPSVAFDTFHERYPELSLFTVGKTVTANVLGGQEAPRLPSTEYVDRLLSSPGFEDFAQQYPAWAIGLVLSKDEDFDLEVFGRSVHEGAVRYRSIDEFLLAGQSTGFWESIDALSSWYYPKREALEARGLDEENPEFQNNELRRRQELYEIWLRYPQYAQDQGIKPVEVTSGDQIPEATWESLGANPPKTIVYSQVRQIIAMDSVSEFPAIQGLKAYMLLRDPIEEEMIRRGIDSIDDDSAVRLGLQSRFEQGTAEIIESFPDAEQLIETFFRNDLEGTRESPTSRLAQRDPERYEAFTRFDTKLENLNDKAFGMPTGDQRDRVFANIRDHINESYRKGESWKMKTWFRNKSAPGRSQYMTTLQGRPAVFYSRFDWELMGVKLTDRAQGWLDRVNVTREYIDQRIDQEVRGGGEFLSGDAFENLDAWVKAHLGKDKTFDAAIKGMRTWGWAAFQPESELVTQKGKAGWAWRYLRDLVGDVNRQIMAYGMHGPDSFDSEDAKQSYVEARDAVLLHLQWLRAKSAVFDEQVDEFQRSALRGDPFLEWLMPDTYYPIGVTGD